MKLFWKTGEPYVLATGAALAIILVMSLTLVGVVMSNGLGYFWPRALIRFELKDGSFALGQVTHMMQCPRKNIGILINTAVENGRARVTSRFEILVGAMAEEEYLQVERPGMHVGIKVGQVGIIGDGFEIGAPTQARTDALGQRSLASSNIPGNNN